MSTHRLTHAALRALSLLCTAVLAVACERTTPRAPFPDPIAATPAQWESYIARLSFDSVALTTDSIVDSMPGGRAVVYLTSARGVARLSDGDVVRGRIIGRADARGVVGRLGAPLGVSYIWVDSVAGAWRWLWISDGRVAGPPQSMVRGTTRFDSKSRSGMKAALDSFPNGRCGSRCCLWINALIAREQPEYVARLFADVHRTQ